MEREIHYAARGLLPCRAKRLGIVSASSESVARGEAVFSVIAFAHAAERLRENAKVGGQLYVFANSRPQKTVGEATGRITPVLAGVVSEAAGPIACLPL
jgi:hypothetical protein